MSDSPKNPVHIKRKDISTDITEVISHGGASSPLEAIGMKWISLPSEDGELKLETGDCEVACDILTGQATFTITSPLGNATFPEAGRRAQIFAGRLAVVYIPPRSHITMSADTANFQALWFEAPCDHGFPPSYIDPEEVAERTVGEGNLTREVYTALGPTNGAERLLLGETINLAGNWSSFPPHKHDQLSEPEVPMEEIYVYFFDPPGGFGIQRVYTDKGAKEPFDVAFPVQEGDAVAIPRGYHPVVAAAGYRLLYVWALVPKGESAANNRKLGAWTQDPAHRWVKV